MPALKRAIRNGINDLPIAGPALMAAYRQIVLLRRIAISRLRPRGEHVLPDPETIYWINPSRIIFHTNFQPSGSQRAPKDRVFDSIKHKGTAQAGDWDKTDFRF